MHLSCPAPEYAALILAGGRGSRMGGMDKGLVTWEGISLAHMVMRRLKSQTTTPKSIWISANRNLEQYAQLGVSGVIMDDRPDFAGPLAGMERAMGHVSEPLLLVVPCDTPLLPLDLFELLHETMKNDNTVRAAYAMTSADQSHPLCCLLRKDLLPNLSAYLDAGQQRVLGWMQQIQAKAVTFQDQGAFVNVNDPQTIAALRSAP